MILNSPTTDADLALIDAYITYLNAHTAPDIFFADRDAFLADDDIAASFALMHLDDSATYLFFDYDSCDTNIIAFLDIEGNFSHAMISSDTMPYEPMTID